MLSYNTSTNSGPPILLEQKSLIFVQFCLDLLSSELVSETYMKTLHGLGLSFVVVYGGVGILCHKKVLARKMLPID